MTRGLKNKYLITFPDGSSIKRDLTDKQYSETKGMAKRSGATVIPVNQEVQ